MQYTVLLAVVAAAAVSAHKVDRTPYKSTTYGAELPPHEHYDCDATEKKCYAPKSYGKSYEPKGYSYHRTYPYPGPKERFCNKLKKIGKFLGGIVKKIFLGFKHTWVHFKHHWNDWCAKKRSDWDRFEDWKACEAKKWKDWWEYHHDLCRTRKALWDDAMREFHRQWCHYRKTRKDEYGDRKKACHVKEKDYDDTSDYKKKVNKYGVTPVEDHYNNYSSAKENKYDQAAYKSHCAKRDAKYEKEYKNLGNHPGTVPTPVGGDATLPAPVGGDVAPATPVTPTGPPAPVSG